MARGGRGGANIAGQPRGQHPEHRSGTTPPVGMANRTQRSGRCSSCSSTRTSTDPTATSSARVRSSTSRVLPKRPGSWASPSPSTPPPVPGGSSAGGHQTLDPFVALGYVAAATERHPPAHLPGRAPYRNPLLLAKAAATVDALSNGRCILGVGTGYLKTGVLRARRRLRRAQRALRRGARRAATPLER